MVPQDKSLYRLQQIINEEGVGMYSSVAAELVSPGFWNHSSQVRGRARSPRPMVRSQVSFTKCGRWALLWSEGSIFPCQGHQGTFIIPRPGKFRVNSPVWVGTRSLWTSERWGQFTKALLLQYTVQHTVQHMVCMGPCGNITDTSCNCCLIFYEAIMHSVRITACALIMHTYSEWHETMVTLISM